MSDVLEIGAFYSRRYIISNCMNWTDCRALKGETLKYFNWKKAQDSKVRIDPRTCNLEVNMGQMGMNVSYARDQLLSVTIEESKDTDNKIQFLQVKMQQNQVLCLTGKKEVLNLFYCGIMFLLDHKVSNHPLVVNKTQEFQGMIANAKQFLNSGILDYTPGVVPPPPSLDNFSSRLPQDPT